jgi:hypothetical protein
VQQEEALAEGQPYAEEGEMKPFCCVECCFARAPQGP